MSYPGQIASRRKREQWASFVAEFRRRQAEALRPPERPQATDAIWSKTSHPRARAPEAGLEAFLVGAGCRVEGY